VTIFARLSLILVIAKSSYNALLQRGMTFYAALGYLLFVLFVALEAVFIPLQMGVILGELSR
jgi:hypothetical protein